eukprot:6337063-Prymnesium_polylepis.1
MNGCATLLHDANSSQPASTPAHQESPVPAAGVSSDVSTREAAEAPQGAACRNIESTAFSSIGTPSPSSKAARKRPSPPPPTPEPMDDPTGACHAEYTSTGASRKRSDVMMLCKCSMHSTEVAACLVTRHAADAMRASVLHALKNVSTES